MAISELTSTNWDKEVIEISKSNPVVVDFWAPWCGPCRMIHPIIEELDSDYQGKITFHRLNTDENPDIASRYNVMSIPTLMLFKNGEVGDMIVGVMPKATLKKKFDEHIED